MLIELPPECWLLYPPLTPKDMVLARAMHMFGLPIENIEWQWKPSGWLVRPRQEKNDAHT